MITVNAGQVNAWLWLTGVCGPAVGLREEWAGGLALPEALQELLARRAGVSY